MSAVQVSDDRRQLINRQVAAGRATGVAEFIEAAVRLYADELETDDAALVAAAEQGLSALRSGDFTTIDGPRSQRAFWESVGKDASLRLAALRATTEADGAGIHQPAGSGPA